MEGGPLQGGMRKRVIRRGRRRWKKRAGEAIPTPKTMGGYCWDYHQAAKRAWSKGQRGLAQEAQSSVGRLPVVRGIINITIINKASAA